MTKLLFFLLVLASWTSAFAGSSYVKYIMSMEQHKIESPRPKVGKLERYEGCGPVAMAMLYGFFHTELGYPMMNPKDEFNGSKHPFHTIKDLYLKAGTKKVPSNSQSYTLPDLLAAAMNKKTNEVNGKRTGLRKLHFKRAKAAPFVPWNKRKDELTSALKKGFPVVALIHNIPPCLNRLNEKDSGWHYIVFNGHNDAKKEFYVLSGWEDKHKNLTSGPARHVRRQTNKDASHIKCSFEEIQKTNPAFFWFEN